MHVTLNFCGTIAESARATRRAAHGTTPDKDHDNLLAAQPSGTLAKMSCLCIKFVVKVGDKVAMHCVNERSYASQS